METTVTNYALIGTYGIQMTLVFLIGLFAWTLKVSQSQVETIAWFKSNAFRIGIAFGLFWLLSASLVIVPNIAQILGSVGFNADQSAAGLAIVIVGLVLKNERTPAATKPVDPIPND